MRLEKAFLLVAVVLVTACGAEVGSAEDSTEEPLLATELLYRDDAPNRDVDFKLDSSLAPYPRIARLIRETKLEEMRGVECDDEADATCIYGSNLEVHYAGERLVSLIDTTSSFYGGAHPSMTASDMTFDVQTGKRVMFGDLFNSWAAARELLQREWCEAVSDHSSCPPLEKQALALSGGASGIDSIAVHTSDYAFGSYAEGSDKAFLSVTPELIALAKPEYQKYFTLEVCC